MISKQELLEKLERELNLKELQIKSLLTITQAINDNVSKDGLYRMYQSFLSWEMGITQMLLFVKSNENWDCVSKINYELDDAKELLPKVLHLKRLYTTDQSDTDLEGFDIVIPVYHKQQPIAYSLIGGIRKKDDLYNKIQFITTITNIIAVAIENKRLFNEMIEKERYKKDMQLASEVQKMLIPTEIPHSDRYAVDLVYRPHSDIGGDYIDYIKFSEDKFALCIADISGKGVAAALLMANFQATLRSLIFQYRDLETFVYALNEAVFKITQSDRFITFFIAEFDTANNTMRYINAGHYPPMLFNNGSIEELKRGTTVIGAFEKLPMIEETTLSLDPGACLLMFTDGLADIMNDKDEYFDETILSPFLLEHKEYTPNEINTELMDRLMKFKGEKSFVDDIAILTCKLI